jgi:hypothetical protein
MVCFEEVCDLTPIRIAHDPKHVFRPYLHVFAHSNELEETGIISLSGVNVESDPFKESLLGVCGIISCSLFAC